MNADEIRKQFREMAATHGSENSIYGLEYAIKIEALAQLAEMNESLRLIGESLMEINKFGIDVSNYY